MTLTPSLARPLLTLSLVAALSGAGGATAASLITGARIKDHTVASIDVRDGSLTGDDVRDGGLRGTDARDLTLRERDFATDTRARLQGSPGIAGYEIVTADRQVAAGESGLVSATCPTGKEAVSVQGFFGTSDTGIQTELTGAAGLVHGHNDLAAPQDLVAQVVCARLHRFVEPD